MNSLQPETLSIRTSEGNPNHHLWNNNGIWFIHYTVWPDRCTKKRVRSSLQTRCVELARLKRDEFFETFEHKSGRAKLSSPPNE